MQLIRVTLLASLLLCVAAAPAPAIVAAPALAPAAERALGLDTNALSSVTGASRSATKKASSLAALKRYDGDDGDDGDDSGDGDYEYSGTGDDDDDDDNKWNNNNNNNNSNNGGMTYHQGPNPRVVYDSNGNKYQRDGALSLAVHPWSLTIATGTAALSLFALV